jgi:signal transduction histidine kinase
LGLKLTTSDITRSVELEASLRRSEVMSIMGSLVANVAHEVRNPLFAISSVLDAFEARFQDQADYQHYTRVLREELGRLNDLMEELLDYGKPPQEQLYQGSIGDVVAHAIRSCTPFAESAEVKIINNMSDELPPVMMCRRRLPKVFSNLVKNAIQYSPPQSTITIEAQEVCAEGRVWIDCTIKDCGPGFRDEDLPRIFEPFYTKRRGGTGLGLSIAQRIMEEHRGRICAGNRPEGGAFMVTRFPVTTSK